MMKKFSALLLALVLLTVTFAAAETAVPSVPKKTIAPFIDLTWEDVALYGDKCRSMTATRRYTGPWEYSVYIMQLDSSVIGGTIHAVSRDSLVDIWRSLAQECLTHFTTYEPLNSLIDSELAGYGFQDGNTYLRLTYVSTGYTDYILFVLRPLPN
ncbi:MAG: hypothetical protein IKL25_02315 [Clostridia bacterium]|nr:hypothetical protein [Clostridia bacterium]